jgi:hypothetical protein
MKTSNLFFFISAVILVQVQAQTNSSYVCGESSANSYARHDPGLVCIIFDFMDPVMKVVFEPRVDKFDVLQIKGLYAKFQDYGKTAASPN